MVAAWFPAEEDYACSSGVGNSRLGASREPTREGGIREGGSSQDQGGGESSSQGEVGGEAGEEAQQAGNRRARAREASLPPDCRYRVVRVVPIQARLNGN